MIQQAIANAIEGISLTEAEAMEAMDGIMSGDATPAQIGAFLVAFRLKGETIDEVTGFARVMRARATRIECRSYPIVDTCGTGGDGKHTFNISTAAAFVAAAAGAFIAKHGGRAASSKAGSADVLTALGVNIETTPEKVSACIDGIGIGFMFAPALHSAMRFASGPRRELGVRTVLNLLGPLTNPAGTTAQVMGVYDGSVVRTAAPRAEQPGGGARFRGAQRGRPGRDHDHGADPRGGGEGRRRQDLRRRAGRLRDSEGVHRGPEGRRSGRERGHHPVHTGR